MNLINKYHKKIIFFSILFLLFIILNKNFEVEKTFSYFFNQDVETINSINNTISIVDNKVKVIKIENPYLNNISEEKSESIVKSSIEQKVSNSNTIVSGITIDSKKIAESIFDNNLDYLNNIFWHYWTFVYRPIRVLINTENIENTINIKNVMWFSNYVRFNMWKNEIKGDIKITLDWNDWLIIEENWKVNKTKRIIIISTEEGSPLEIVGFNRIKDFWTSKYNDNKFLISLDIINNNWKFEIINEIDLENYVKGVAEVVWNTHIEKMKAMSLIIRSYAWHYASQKGDIKEILKDKNYTATDQPSNFQKYLWHSYTERNPKWSEVVDATKGEMIYYKDILLKAAYSSCTLSGWYRFTLEEKGWGWDYFNSVKDVYQKVEDKIGIDPNREEKYCGHWVWLSWYWAEELAKSWKNYKEIIKNYYIWVEIK